MDASWCMRRSKDLRSGAPDKIRTCDLCLRRAASLQQHYGQRDHIGRLSKEMSQFCEHSSCDPPLQWTHKLRSTVIRL